MKITDQKLAAREHLTRRGTVEYQIDNANFPSGIWGREHFTLTRHRNGDRVLRAFCELDDEPAGGRIGMSRARDPVPQGGANQTTSARLTSARIKAWSAA